MNSRLSNKPLLLEYCRLPRAARLLGCEEEDLLHWAAIAAIKLCIRLHRHPVVLTLDSGQLPRHSNSELGHFNKDNQLVVTTRYARFESQITRHSSPHYPANGTGNLPGTRQAVLDGFVALGQATANLLEMGYPITLEGCKNGNELAALGGAKHLRFTLLKGEGQVQELRAEDLWLLRTDIELLQHHLTCGKPLPNIYNNAGIATEVQQHQDRCQSWRSAQPTSVPAASHPFARTRGKSPFRTPSKRQVASEPGQPFGDGLNTCSIPRRSPVPLQQLSSKAY